MMDPSYSGQRRSLCIQMDAYEALLVHLLGNLVILDVGHAGINYGSLNFDL